MGRQNGQGFGSLGLAKGEVGELEAVLLTLGALNAFGDEVHTQVVGTWVGFGVSS